MLDKLKDQIKQYFDLSSYLENENDAKQAIIEGVSFRGPNIIILIIAIIIASLGLNVNSPAVIIGAMLISPLMGPIIGIGLGAGTYDYTLIKRAARNLCAAAMFSIIASTIYFLISPVSEGRSELLARTSPTIYDVLIGFFGGAAGIVAMACKQKGNVLPGVAIATALMPPLCTVGYGIATLQVSYITGALYLFIINSIFIALATLVGVKIFKFHEVNYVDDVHKHKMKRIITGVAIATVLPSIYLTVLMMRDSFFVNDAINFVEEEINLPNTQVFSKKAYTKNWKKYLDVTLIGEDVNVDSLRLALEAQMDKRAMLKGTILNLRQGFTTGNMRENPTQSMGEIFTSVMSRIETQKHEIDSLRSIIAQRNTFDSLSYAIAPELKVLYPEITDIALSRNFVCNTETRRIDTLDVALIQHTAPLKNLPTIERYIETRTGFANIHVIQINSQPQAKK